jgi:hypothetical protein
MNRTYAIQGWNKKNEIVSIPISESAYQEVVAAKAHLLDCVAIEDTFDQFIENYFEYESDVLGLAHRQSVQLPDSWSAAQLETQNLNSGSRTC